MTIDHLNIPSYFLLIGDHFSRITNERSVKIENDIDEKDDINYWVYDKNTDVFILLLWVVTVRSEIFVIKGLFYVLYLLASATVLIW